MRANGPLHERSPFKTFSKQKQDTNQFQIHSSMTCSMGSLIK